MSGHADTIRRIRNQLPADVARDFDALLAENQRLQETLRLREQEQIPMIPTGAKRKMDSLEAENERLRDALNDAKDRVARIAVATHDRPAIERLAREALEILHRGEALAGDGE